MSDSQLPYPLDHRVFSGGRYLRAFDHLHDIDHFEHSILTYLGSLMPFDKGFVDHPAFPSVATIARSTKISESTVRKKIKSLTTKGYIRVKAVRLLNYQGHFQQSSNNYLFCKQAFAIFDDVLATQNHIDHLRKRAVGESYPCVPQQPSPAPLPVGSCTLESAPVAEAQPNSLPKVPKESPLTPDSSASGRNISTMRAEVDRIVRAWEDVVGKPVSRFEKERFLQEFVRLRGHEVFYMERIFLLIDDPYLMARAQSLNFLFSGFDAAQKNQREIQSIAKRALDQVETPAELDSVLEQIPHLIATKSRNYANPAQAVIDFLVKEPLDSACDRLKIRKGLSLPKNDAELRTEIDRLLQSDLIPEEGKERLKTIQCAVSRCAFARCIELYARFVEKFLVHDKPGASVALS